MKSLRLLPLALALASACGPRAPDSDPRTPAASVGGAAGEPRARVGPEPAQPGSAATRAGDGQSVAPARDEPTYRLAWLVPSPEWTKAVAIAPWGDVVSYGSRTLRVHARDSGKVVAETGTCFTFPGAFGFVGDRIGAMVCEDSINLFSFPDATYRGVRKLPGPARAAGFGARMLAVADARGRVRLFATSDWREQTMIDAQGRVSALAVARDDSRVAIGLEDGSIQIHTLGAQERIAIDGRPGDAVSVLAFSPDGRSLLGSAGPLVALWAVADGSRSRRFNLVRELGTARWLSNEDVAVTGPDGLFVVRVSDGSVRGIGDGSDEGTLAPIALDASADARVLCIGAPSGSVRCYVRGRERVAAATARPERPAAPGGESCVAGPGQLATMSGRIVSHQSGHRSERLLVRVGDGAPPLRMGQCGRLRWHWTGRQGDVEASSWRDFGDVRVDDVRGDVVHLVGVGGAPEQGTGPVAGDPLPHDTPVLLQWTTP